MEGLGSMNGIKSAGGRLFLADSEFGSTEGEPNCVPAVAGSNPVCHSL
jgi:hypothetical protein